MDKIILLLVVFITINLTANEEIFTKKERNWLENNIVTVGVEQWEPVVNMNHNNDIDGIAGDVLKLIIKKTGIKVNYVSDEWTTLLQDFENKKIDLLPATYYTDERAKYGLYSKSYFKMKEYIYLKQDNNSIKTFDDLKGKKIAIIKDYGTIPKIKEKYPTIQIVETKNILESLNFVLENKVDAYIDVQIGVVNTLNKNVIVGIKSISQNQFEPSPLHFFSNIDKPILQKILNKSLANISKQEYSSIISKWLNEINESKSNLKHLTPNEVKYISENRVIKMCNNPNWVPIEFVKDGTPKGIAIDILNEIEKKLYIKFEHIETSSWSQSQQFLKEKKCDILPAATQTSKRKKYANFTEPYLSYPLAIITKSDKAFIKDIDSILDKTMSRKKGSGLISVLKKQYPSIKIKETTGYEESLKEVSAGNVYYTIATLPVASHYISKFGLYNLHISGHIDKEFKLSIAVRDDKPELLNILNKTLKVLPQNLVKKIEDNWSNIKITEKKVINYTNIVQILVVVFVISILLAYRQNQIKKHQKELENKNIKFKRMLNSTMEGIVLVENNKIIDVNNATLKLYGVENKDKIIGGSALDIVADESKKLVLEKFTNKDFNPYELFLLRCDGSKYPALMQSNQYDTDNGNMLIITIINLTDIKRKEKLLSHSGKMAQMGEMIGNIAHQWRQPLSVITTAATGMQLKKEYEILTDEEMNELLESIMTNANHLSLTIDIFRNFIKEKIELKSVVIQDRIDNALGIIKTRLESKHIKLINKVDYENKLDVVIVVGELSQVIINIINNAIDILTDNGNKNSHSDKNKWIKINLNNDYNNAIISIEDNGGGIPEDILPKIFEPYFTTKHKSVGTGIGLYMSYDIIVNHMHGDLYAQNTKNGAKFYIKIPLEKRFKKRRQKQSSFKPPEKREKNRRV